MKAEKEPRSSLVSLEKAQKLDELKAWDLVIGLLGKRGDGLWKGHCLQPLLDQTPPVCFGILRIKTRVNSCRRDGVLMLGRFKAIEIVDIPILLVLRTTIKGKGPSKKQEEFITYSSPVKCQYPNTPVPSTPLAAPLLS